MSENFLEQKIQEEFLQKTKEEQDAFLTVFIACFGVITKSCKTIGIPYGRYRKWISTDQEFRARVEEAKQEINDVVENLFIENDVRSNDKRGMIARMFFLKTHNRQYVESRGRTISEKQEAYSAEDYFKERAGKVAATIEKK